MLLRRKSGISLAIVLIAVMVTLALSMIAVKKTFSESRATKKKALQTQAYWLCESAIQKFHAGQFAGLESSEKAEWDLAEDELDGVHSAAVAIELSDFTDPDYRKLFVKVTLFKDSPLKDEKRIGVTGYSIRRLIPVSKEDSKND